MAPITTCGGNHELLRALNAHGVRYIVVGGAATIHYVPNRPTEHAGELDLLIDPTVPNVENLLAALHSINYFHPDYTVERLTGPMWIRLPVDNGSLYADILTPEGGEDFETHWKRALPETIAGFPVKVVSIKSQIERLQRSEVPKHRHDVQLLRTAHNLREAASLLHTTFNLASRAWSLLHKFTASKNPLGLLRELEHALTDSLLQTAIIETWKMFDPDPRSGLIIDVKNKAPIIGVPLPALADDPEIVASIRTVAEVRDKIAAHVDRGVSEASYAGVPVLLQAARPFVKEFTTSLGLPFYEAGTKQAVQQLDELIARMRG